MEENEIKAQKHSRGYSIALFARKWIVLLSIVIVVGVAICYLQIATPVYKATAELLHAKQSTMPLIVENFQFASTPLDLEAQRVIVKSPFVTGPAIASLNAVIPNLNLTSKAIEESIELDSPRGSAILHLSATAGSPMEAALIANTVAVFYQKYTTERKRKDLTAALKFLEKQKNLLENLLAKDEENLQIFREKVGLSPTTSDNPTANFSLLNQLWQYHEDLVKAEWEEEMTNVQLNSVKELIDQKRREIAPETHAPLLTGDTSEIDRLQDKLLELNLS